MDDGRPPEESELWKTRRRLMAAVSDGIWNTACTPEYNRRWKTQLQVVLTQTLQSRSAVGPAKI
jgi:hypothetical protein